MTIQMLQKVEIMNNVPHCWKIVREETKGRNQDCTDPKNCKSNEQERH